MTRRKRIALTIAVLVALQAAVLLIYRAVQRSREEPVRFAAERLTDSAPAPTIVGERADGSRVSLSWPARNARIIHFWGTWCGPCRTELPSLLSFAARMRAHGVEVVAIAVQDEWTEISAFFGGRVPPEVVVEVDGDAHKRFGVGTLPDTYLVDRSGKLLERFHGARDWTSDAARTHLLASLDQ